MIEQLYVVLGRDEIKIENDIPERTVRSHRCTVRTDVRTSINLSHRRVQYQSPGDVPGDVRVL